MSKSLQTLLTRVLPAAILSAAFSLPAVAGPVLWVDDVNGTLGKVDVTTGVVSIVGNMGHQMTDIAFDPSGNLYGITFGQLFRINTSTGAATLVGNLGTTLNSLVFGADGTLYGAQQQLFSINTTTGAASMINNGSPGDAFNSAGDLAFVNGTLYLSGASNFLYSLNTSTGQGTQIGPIGYANVYGLATDDNANLFGVSGTTVLSVNPFTGNGVAVTDFSGSGLSTAYGSAFYTEAGAPDPSDVPEPGSLALLGLCIAGLLAARRKQPA